jgi:aryl carrier-like protein
VKVRGFRIELGEIESVLNTHSAIRESVVTCDTRNGKRLVAYIVPKDSVPPTDELRRHLQRKLPEYMVPSRFVTLSSMPLTVNGKVDRKALPPIETKRPPLRTEFAAPRNEDEALLADIWEQVLDIDQVGIHDNFFELGGDSIRSIQVLAQAQQRGIFFSLQKLFQKPTIAELAAQLDSAPEDQTGPQEITGRGGGCLPIGKAAIRNGLPYRSGSPIGHLSRRLQLPLPHGL